MYIVSIDNVSLCAPNTQIAISGYESMQRDIRQENRMNTLTISEGQKMYL
jgi:hypothetical protein